MLTCYGGVAASEGTWQIKNAVRGLAACFAAHTHTCGVPPTLNTAVRVEFMARQVPSQAREMLHIGPFRYAFVSLPLINSLY